MLGGVVKMMLNYVIHGLHQYDVCWNYRELSSIYVYMYVTTETQHVLRIQFCCYGTQNKTHLQCVQF